jgi:hypothetical protein
MLRVFARATGQARSLSTAAGGPEPIKTALYDWHVKRGGKMVPFAGYWLPVLYEVRALPPRVQLCVFGGERVSVRCTRGMAGPYYWLSIARARTRRSGCLCACWSCKNGCGCARWGGPNGARARAGCGRGRDEGTPAHARGQLRERL